jgi:hypothetical protein
MIYWIAAIEKPKKKKAKEGEEEHTENEKLLVAPQAIVAKTEQSAAFKVARMKELADADADRVEILVRPF